MIVPSYWAEAKRTVRVDEHEITVRRFGWSDEGQSQADEHADARIDEAVEQIMSDEPTDLREPKVPYNGADGLPIREEIVARRGDAVLTRNAYGALCLNTPDVLFADVDALDDWSASAYKYTFLVYLVAYGFAAWENAELRSVSLFLLGALFVVVIVGSGWHWVLNQIRVSPKQVARKRIERFANRNRDWSMRLYETPRGWRVLVTHDTFDPRGDAVRAFFKAIETDPIYARMCFNQNCFRARVSPKPWRIGIDDHMKPRPGVWPLSADRMPDREQWVRRYERESEGFSSCRFIATIGSIMTCQNAVETVRWHDELSRSGSTMPIA